MSSMGLSQVRLSSRTSPWSANFATKWNFTLVPSGMVVPSKAENFRISQYWFFLNKNYVKLIFERSDECSLFILELLDQYSKVLKAVDHWLTIPFSCMQNFLLNRLLTFFHLISCTEHQSGNLKGSFLHFSGICQRFKSRKSFQSYKMMLSSTFICSNIFI